MSTRPQDPARDARAPGYDDRTRDIRLPLLPDRPPAAVHPGWQAHVLPAAAEPASTAAPGGQSGTAPPASADAVRTPDPAPPRPYVLPDEPTDELPPRSRVRQQTLAFDAPEGPPQTPAQPPPATGSPTSGAPSAGSRTTAAPGPTAPSLGTPPSAAAPGPTAAAERQRRWPWVVLTVLPVLVIFAAALLLFFLLGAA